jgi:hypothetical protein
MANYTIDLNHRAKASRFAKAHPDYISYYEDDEKYRYIKDSGRDFVEEYLEQFSSRESADDFKARQKISPPSADAKAAVQEVANSLIARLPSVTRRGGDATYQSAVGTNVDGMRNSMNSFIARKVIGELLFMGKVGIYVDKGIRVMPNDTKIPYLYTYKKEDILNWLYDSDGTLVNVLLQEQVYIIDPISGLPTGVEPQTKQMILRPGGLEVSITGSNGPEEPMLMPWDQIPFTILELEESLLKDIADYQIALLNMESSDVMYSLKSNFPFYTEQGSAGMGSWMRPAAETEGGTVSEAGKNEIKVGNTQGRVYAPNMDRPDFIAPPTAPLEISMKKEQQIRETITRHLHLTLTNLRPVRLSSDAKAQEFQGMEAGMYTIGYTLEQAENEIASIWSMYQGSKEVAVVKYPASYTQMSPEQRDSGAERKYDLSERTPSTKLKRELHIQAAQILLSGISDQDTIDQVIEEILSAKLYDVEPEKIRSDHEAGLVGTAFASTSLGYPKGEAEQAAKDHADRLARIAAAQSTGDATSRLTDGSDPEDRKGEKAESQNSDDNDTPATRTRGEAK